MRAGIERAFDLDPAPRPTEELSTELEPRPGPELEQHRSVSGLGEPDPGTVAGRRNVFDGELVEAVGEHATAGATGEMADLEHQEASVGEYRDVAVTRGEPLEPPDPGVPGSRPCDERLVGFEARGGRPSNSGVGPLPAHPSGRIGVAARRRRERGMRIGMLTGGGDCPGLNAVIRAVVRRGAGEHGYDFVGYRHGWRGLIDGETMPLSLETTHGLLARGGTILGTSRTNPYKVDGGVERVKVTMLRDEVEALIAIGGEDTLGVAHKLSLEGVSVVGVPKTIDNDLSATDFAFGFHTAVQTATDAIDRLHTTAESHDRVMVVEVMGRHAGWIAAYAGIAGGADIVLVPEEPFDLADVCERLARRHRRGVGYSILVVAEGATPKAGTMVLQDGDVDAFGHVRLGGIGNALAPAIEERTGFETRVTMLGHVLRGGTPTAYDRVIATRFGLAAIDAVHTGAFATMVALRGTDVVTVPIEDGVAELNTVDERFYADARAFFA